MKFNQYKLFLILCVAISLNAKAQKEANNWYFGNGAGITFNSGSPVPISGSQLFTTEGCSSISDANGNLLFYTDGITVWNQNHLAMPNGNGLNGNVSSTQSALIVQKPGSQNLYYIFVIDIDFRYSIVDMSLQGGLGDVSQKNSLILAGCASEKQCATYHSNGNDIWIMMHTMNSNIFNAYLLTSSGLTMTPVVSTIGMVHSSPYGQMKFSPNGNRLALGVYNTGPVMELFDFDKSTGLVSNNLPITTTYQQCYGLEFSPDRKSTRLNSSHRT